MYTWTKKMRILIVSTKPEVIGPFSLKTLLRSLVYHNFSFLNTLNGILKILLNEFSLQNLSVSYNVLIQKQKAKRMPEFKQVKSKCDYKLIKI